MSSKQQYRTKIVTSVDNAVEFGPVTKEEVLATLKDREFWDELINQQKLRVSERKEAIDPRIEVSANAEVKVLYPIMGNRYIRDKDWDFPLSLGDVEKYLFDLPK